MTQTKVLMTNITIHDRRYSNNTFITNIVSKRGNRDKHFHKPANIFVTIIASNKDIHDKDYENKHILGKHYDKQRHS